MRLPHATTGLLTLALLAFGCSSDGGDAGQNTTTGCIPGQVFDCACTDGSTSQQVCNESGALDPCACGIAEVATTGGTTSTGTGGSVSSTGATTGSGGTNVAAGGTVGAGGSTSAGGTVAAGGTAGGAGGTIDTGGTPGAGGGPVLTAQDPVVPPINGECPTFMTQTLNFMSLQGINMQAGPPSNGSGILLFYWHGTGSSAGEVGLIGQANTQRILDTGGIIISPQSSTGSTAGLQASGTSVWFDEDLVTADQIAACAVANYGIDPHRIYATGCSAGGLMSGYMAAQRWQYVAAVAPNSGGGLGQSFAGATHVPPVMTMHGAAGTDVVIIDFADQSLQFDAAVKSAGGFAIDCDHGGGHCGAPADLYTSAITFLLDHPFGVSPEPYAAGLPAGFPAYCQIQ
jgi:hypothetical protein